MQVQFDKQSFMAKAVELFLDKVQKHAQGVFSTFEPLNNCINKWHNFIYYGIAFIETEFFRVG